LIIIFYYQINKDTKLIFDLGGIEPMSLGKIYWKVLFKVAHQFGVA